MSYSHAIPDGGPTGQVLVTIWANALTVTLRSASPFWRSRTADGRHDSSPKKQSRDPGLVVGASYSHADMLKFDNLYV